MTVMASLGQRFGFFSFHPGSAKGEREFAPQDMVRLGVMTVMASLGQRFGFFSFHAGSAKGEREFAPTVVG